MICAHTVRRLKPGAFEEFVATFSPPADSVAPKGWVRFNVLRSLADPDQVVTFGFFDGSLEDLNASQQEHGYGDMVSSVAGLVESVEINGIFEIAVDLAGGA